MHRLIQFLRTSVLILVKPLLSSLHLSHSNICVRQIRVSLIQLRRNNAHIYSLVPLFPIFIQLILMLSSIILVVELYTICCSIGSSLACCLIVIELILPNILILQRILETDSHITIICIKLLCSLNRLTDISRCTLNLSSSIQDRLCHRQVTSTVSSTHRNTTALRP